MGDQAGTESMIFIGFPSDDRLDVDAGKAEFVDVVAQHGIFFVFGDRAERDVNAQAQSYVVITLYAP